MAHSVLYMSPTSQPLRDLILSEEPPGFVNSWIETDSQSEIEAKLADADFVVTGEITSEQIARATRLKLIQMPGVGYENIDVEAANARGIPVAITPEGTIVGVAEHTIMMMLAIYKHLTEAHSALARGEWIHNRLRPICLMLDGKRLGIVGMGRIGREVAKRLRGWNVDLVYSDIRRLSPNEEAELRATYVPLDELLRTSDVVTLHVFLSEGSRYMIGERELELMKSTSVIINTSRGGVVDEAALYRALSERRILGAGIDAWEQEPTPPDNSLLRLDNVLLTPHMATANRDAVIQKSRACYANFQRVLRGEAPLNTVRPYQAIEAALKSPSG
ncbi:MAG TPA: 2-hydroxyacid dehydrogenase [Chloroflexota bacterium]|nr:2-hydroxyacid dehydrogenase [Chloroflexota bacterium]